MDFRLQWPFSQVEIVNSCLPDREQNSNYFHESVKQNNRAKRKYLAKEINKIL